jgi:hypothetical protein
MKIHHGGMTSGHVDSQVTQINFSNKGNTNAQGNCPTTFKDLFVTSVCGTNGASGAAQYDDDGYLIGIVTYSPIILLTLFIILSPLHH